MLIHGILNLYESDNIYFVEDSYAAERELSRTIPLLQNIARCEGLRAIIIDGGCDCTGLAIFNEETDDTPAFWSVFTDAVCAPVEGRNAEYCQLLQEIIGKSSTETVHASGEELRRAIREYYSTELVHRELCPDCREKKEPYDMVYVRSRVGRLKKFLGTLDLDTSVDMLEICCGNGMATAALHDLGFSPLCTDFDKCQVCQGLEHGVLVPADTAVIDATRLSRFFTEKSFDMVAGFMMGTIYPYNAGLWKLMLHESVKVAKDNGTLLVTVNRKEEADIVASALEEYGVAGELIDNTDERGLYDQWAYLGKRTKNFLP
ncbi:MAG TPA: class I SAM-dependent methyltransferase [Candidatus Methanoperedenaceae archaeon]|nr:class I SAM-dependent methyltransferase [Candidatus Methanoperedenaceae archaeon]